MLDFLNPYLNSIKAVLIGFIVASVLALGLVAGYYKSKYEGQIEIVAKVKTELEQSNLSLQTCSDSIDKLSKESVKKLADAAEAIKAAQADAKKYRIKADNLLAAKPADSDLCKASTMLMQEYLSQIGESK